ncbi:hypothetical protein GQ44DRAFT_712833 [Phaeosphaeriaceae sp. PMI808]|nr:hypothetical protein GQ44DRAFT_712833 [Phaeosphaeriaceae sp. PMI808]
MPYLYSRQNPLDDAKTTFSSWDNCMAKSYCKYVDLILVPEETTMYSHLTGGQS